MEDHGQVVAFLKEAAELAVGVAEGRIEVNEYVESIDALKANVPPEHLAEVEVAIQLAALKIDHEAIKTSEEIRACYRIAAKSVRKAIAEIRNMPLK